LSKSNNYKTFLFYLLHSDVNRPGQEISDLKLLSQLKSALSLPQHDMGLYNSIYRSVIFQLDAMIQLAC
jgi:hypothetical protein